MAVVRTRIPALHRLRLLAVYTRLLWGYNLFLSAIGGAALVAVRSAGLLGSADLIPGQDQGPVVELTDASAASFWLAIALLLFGTAGHWLAAALLGTAHRAELPLYRGAGWRPAGLAFGSWVASLAVAGALLLVVFR